MWFCLTHPVLQLDYMKMTRKNFLFYQTTEESWVQKSIDNTETIEKFYILIFLCFNLFLIVFSCI